MFDIDALRNLTAESKAKIAARLAKEEEERLAMEARKAARRDREAREQAKKSMEGVRIICEDAARKGESVARINTPIRYADFLGERPTTENLRGYPRYLCEEMLAVGLTVEFEDDNDDHHMWWTFVLRW